jgi:hypothetical protein
MQKTHTYTVLAIFFLATAVVLIGGLVVLPTTTTMQSASAKKSVDEASEKADKIWDHEVRKSLEKGEPHDHSKGIKTCEKADAGFVTSTVISPTGEVIESTGQCV